MADEIRQEPKVDTTKVDTTKVDISKVADTKPTELMDVDLDGITVKVPVDTAKKMIEKRQEKHALFNEISNKAKKYEAELAETKRLAEAKEAALNGKLAEAEALFSRKAEEKLTNIQNRIITKEIESVLLSDDTFLKESLDDAIKLLKADKQFKLSEDGEKVITDDGKDAGEAIKEWLSTKNIFKKANAIPNKGNNIKPLVKVNIAKPINLGEELRKRFAK